MSTAIERAAELLRAGGLVAFPTETVYGLGADAANAIALRRLYAVKGRPADHPVIVHIPADAGLDAYARAVPDVARELAEQFWPGPLTLVLLRRPAAVTADAAGGRETVGLRVPAEATALALLDAFGGGIAAPSANRFGRVSPTTAAHVHSDLGDDVDLVLDGGPCMIGIESTIVDLSGDSPRIVRVGAIDVAALAPVLGDVAVGSGAAAPGTLAHHYAPRARVELSTPAAAASRAVAHTASGRRVALLALTPPSVSEPVIVLLPPVDVEEYARVLYARLRDADAAGVDVLVVVPPPEVGLGIAVGDRLRRAAASSVA
ncbi:MAG: L-threonylcarbamoyladenylate synthase [Actinomycetota bacterium]